MYTYIKELTVGRRRIKANQRHEVGGTKTDQWRQSRGRWRGTLLIAVCLWTCKGKKVKDIVAKVSDHLPVLL